jgi:hypothetical protein
MSPRLRAAVLLFAVAFLVRAAFIVLEPPTRRVGDEPRWIAVSQELAAAGFSPLGTAQVFYPPLYSYFLGGLSAAFGGLTAVKWGQAVLGALLAPLLFRLGERVRGERVGLTAGWLAAFYPELVWHCAHFWSEILLIALLWWAFERLVASERGSAGVAMAAGLLFGLAALTRETALPFVPVAALWLAFGREAGRRRAVAFLLAATVVLAPWTLRNFALTGGFVPVTARGGYHLWVANAERPEKEIYREYHEVQGGPIAQERYARREALRSILDRQPRWLLDKITHEMPAFWGIYDMVVLHVERRAYKGLPASINRLVAAVTVLPYLVVLGLAVPALASLRRDRPTLLLIGFLLYYLAFHVVTFGFPRYRMPLLPVLFLLAAQTIDRGPLRSWREMSRGRRTVAVLFAAAFAVCVALSATPVLRNPAFAATPSQDEDDR